MKSLFGDEISDKPANPRPPDKAHAATPGTGPVGKTCGMCEHRCRVQYHDYVYQKCGLLEHQWTHGPGTDIRAKDQACRYFVPVVQEGGGIAAKPRYSIGTWDGDMQAYTPQAGAGAWHNLTLMELRQAIQRVRACGYSAHRRGNVRDGHDDNDWCVLIERTDGMSEAEVLESWRR